MKLIKFFKLTNYNKSLNFFRNIFLIFLEIFFYFIINNFIKKIINYLNYYVFLSITNLKIKYCYFLIHIKN